jgi:hypothetical protein
MKFKLTIDCDNAAFEDGVHYELADILTRLAIRVRNDLTGSRTEIPVFDHNGNTVGWGKLTK